MMSSIRNLARTTLAIQSFVATDREIWTVAGLMLQQFGDRAVVEASLRAQAARSNSDVENDALWRRVIKAIAALTETQAGIMH
jgi:hypothetical protein